MNTNPIPASADQDPDKSPFEFWAAYIPGKGKQKHYLGNGKAGKAKGIRLFKSEEAAWSFLKEQLEQGRLSQKAYDQIVVHSVEGKLALPAQDPVPSPLVLHSNQRILKSPDHLQPITTLHKPSVPTPVELLDDYLRRRKRRRRH